MFFLIFPGKTYCEPAHDNTYDKTCDQQYMYDKGFHFNPLWIAQSLLMAHVISENSHHTEQMRRLILVFAGCTSLIVGFVVR